MSASDATVSRLYRRFAGLATRYRYTFSRPAVTEGGLPVLLFLGNHSSGKSSLVNALLGAPAVQETGVAPTDDGFTVIVYGEAEEETYGPAALAKLPAEFQVLTAFGPVLLQHLCVKARRRDLLRHVCLVDSPGMIDGAAEGPARGYDFAGVVRRFAEIADLVFFLFDPEKPGTTGETVNVFSQSLRGFEFKLRVLLNKCDTFTELYDFARAYGTLCWNLARVLPTKDLPRILTVYTGASHGPAAQPFSHADFDRHRAELRTLVDTAAARRDDSVRAAAEHDFAGLSMRMRMVNAVARRLGARRLRVVLLCLCAMALLGAAAGVVVGQALGADLRTWSLASGTAALAALFVAGLSAWLEWKLAHWAEGVARRRLADGVDEVFRQVYRSELAVARADDLKARWQEMREETAAIIRSGMPSIPWGAERRRNAVDSACASLQETRGK